MQIDEVWLNFLIRHKVIALKWSLNGLGLDILQIKTFEYVFAYTHIVSKLIIRSMV